MNLLTVVLRCLHCQHFTYISSPLNLPGQLKLKFAEMMFYEVVYNGFSFRLDPANGLPPWAVFVRYYTNIFHDVLIGQKTWLPWTILVSDWLKH